MKIDRFMIFAPKAAVENNDNLRHVAFAKGQRKKVASYKCGPDYIDQCFTEEKFSMSLQKSGYIFTDERTTMRLLQMEELTEILLYLRVLWDYMTDLVAYMSRGRHTILQKVTHTPIILVVDAKGMGKSVPGSYSWIFAV